MKCRQSLARYRNVSAQSMSTNQVKVTVPKIRPHLDGPLQPRDSIAVATRKKIRLPDDPIENTDRWVTRAQFYCFLRQRRRVSGPPDIDQLITFLGISAGMIRIDLDGPVKGHQRRLM